MITPGPLLAAGALVAFAGLFHRRGGDRCRRGLAGALFAGTGLMLVVISVATGMYEMRYLMPALLLVPVGAALAIQQLRPTPGEGPTRTSRGGLPDGQRRHHRSGQGPAEPDHDRAG